MPNFEHESALMAKGHDVVCGVDEAGRGPLAGPVVAAAVILDPANIPADLNDSKKLSASQREALLPAILASGHVSLATASAAMIDQMNIRAASLEAMRQAVMALHIPADAALIDGNAVPLHMPCFSQTLVKGDALSSSIAAASIVAKTVRDRIMIAHDKGWPNYGFAKHKGYPTAEHRSALALHGPCPLHRMSFAPVRLALEKRP
ncbi:MAG: ribonuclease HII [Ahrensia sp.]|nr:ribonuclease HII [Ahrensia sp.]